jgi:hypothetical protein
LRHRAPFSRRPAEMDRVAIRACTDFRFFDRLVS